MAEVVQPSVELAVHLWPQPGHGPLVADVGPGEAVTVRCDLGSTMLAVVAKVARRQKNVENGVNEIALEFTCPNPLVAEIFRQLERAALARHTLQNQAL